MPVTVVLPNTCHFPTTVEKIQVPTSLKFAPRLLLMYQFSVTEVLQKGHDTPSTSALIKLFCASVLNHKKLYSKKKKKDEKEEDE